MLKWFCALMAVVIMLFTLPVHGGLGEVNIVSSLNHLDVPKKQMHDSLEDTVIHFPDPNFEAVVRDMIGKPEGELLASDVAGITSLVIAADDNVTNLTGLEHFTALNSLSCYDAQLTSLDVRKNQALTSLECMDIKIKTLDLSQNAMLEYVTVDGSELTSLDVSKNKRLILIPN